MATTAASVAQYGLSSGEKTGQGYLAAGAIGLIAAPFVFTPYKVPSGAISRWVYAATRPGRVMEWERGADRSAVFSAIRSFGTSAIAGLVQPALGAEESTGVDASSPATGK